MNSSCAQALFPAAKPLIYHWQQIFWGVFLKKWSLAGEKVCIPQDKQVTSCKATYAAPHPPTSTRQAGTHCPGGLILLWNSAVPTGSATPAMPCQLVPGSALRAALKLSHTRYEVEKDKKKPNQSRNNKTPNLTFSKGSTHTIVLSSQGHYLFNKGSVVGVIPRRYPAASWHCCSGSGMLREAGAGTACWVATLRSQLLRLGKQVLYKGEAVAINPVASYMQRISTMHINHHRLALPDISGSQR